MAELIVPDKDLKMLREALCAAQHAVNQSAFNRSRHEVWSADLQKLINECDRHRPLGVDGKHGNRHTDTCGCEDKPINANHIHHWKGVYFGVTTTVEACADPNCNAARKT